MNNVTGYWHSDTKLISLSENYLSGNTITRNNDPTRFYITPSADIKRARDAIQEFVHQSKDSKTIRRPGQGPVKLNALIESFRNSTCTEDFGASLDAIFIDRSWDFNAAISARNNGWESNARPILRRFLMMLWRERIILFPVCAQITGSIDDDCFGASSPCITEINSMPTIHGINWLKRALLSMWGVESLLDLTPEVLNPGILNDLTMPQYMKNNTSALYKHIFAYQAAHNREKLRHSVSDYVVSKNGSPRSMNGAKFQWAVEADVSCKQWQDLAASYLESGVRGKTVVQSALNQFLQYLIDTPEAPRDPLVFFDVRRTATKIFVGTTPYANNAILGFFDWVIETCCCNIDNETGRSIVFPWVQNPLSKQRRHDSHGGQTHRDAMPILLVEKSIEILTKDDWFWAKNLSRERREVIHDWYRYYDKKTNQWRTMWSPVRAVAIYVKLRTVLRTLQVTLLDSGEMDNYKIEMSDLEHHSYVKVKNKHPLASRNLRRPIEKGVLQTFVDETNGQLAPFLRISTNKTADLNKNISKRGYDCPWAPDDVVEKLIWLREWQERYNPVHSPVDWSDIPLLRHRRVEEDLHGMSSCFLFRNPYGANPAHPIRPDSLTELWRYLCVEVQSELATEGLVDAATGKEFVLVERDEKGNFIGLRYDLHSLRVTNVSALYKGGLPVKIIMLICGHATVPMSLYYTKYSMTEIKECTSKAEHAVMLTAQNDWARALKNQKLHDLRPLLALNSIDGLNNFIAAEQGMVFMDVGICSAGCSKCDVGVSITEDGDSTKSVRQFSPVPGGQRNCASCRFIVSGPPFLHGLNAAFNHKSLVASEVARRRTEAEKKKAILETERSTSSHFEKWDELQSATEEFYTLTVEIDQVLDEMRAVVSLISQSIIIQNSNIGRTSELDEDQKMAFVVNDLNAVKMQLEESTEFDLVDRVCQASVFFQTTRDSTSNRANLLRMRYYDKMLQREGLPPAFLDLDEETGLRSGNALSQLLQKRIGRQGTLQLIAGLKKLADFSLAPEEVYGSLTQTTAHPIGLSIKPTERSHLK